MGWDFIKYRLRRRAEGAVLAISSYIHGEEESEPEVNLEEHLRRKAKIRKYDEGML